jgi:hypothetical protein
MMVESKRLNHEWNGNESADGTPQVGKHDDQQHPGYLVFPETPQ